MAIFGSPRMGCGRFFRLESEAGAFWPEDDPTFAKQMAGSFPCRLPVP